MDDDIIVLPDTAEIARRWTEVLNTELPKSLIRQIRERLANESLSPTVLGHRFAWIFGSEEESGKRHGYTGTKELLHEHAAQFIDALVDNEQAARTVKQALHDNLQFEGIPWSY